MLPLIILFSVLFAAISIGVQIFISKKNPLKFIDDNNTLDSSKVKISAIILLILNAYDLINYIISLANIYSKDYIVFDMEEELGVTFFHTCSLLIVLSYIIFAIFLIKKCKRLALLSATSIIILLVFNAIFISNTNTLNAYISLFPSLLVLSSFIILFTPFHIGYQKIIKATPFLFLLGMINPVFNVITLGVLNIGFILSIAATSLKIVAFIVMFNAVVPSLKNDESNNNATPSISSTKKNLIVLSILIFPLVVSLLSSIGKVLLWGTTFVVAIFLIIAYKITEKENTKVRKNTLIITAVIVILICIISTILPSNSNDDYDPYECFWCEGSGMCEDAYGKLHYCSHCHGSGRQ